jgi:hypothetical protein
MYSRGHRALCETDMRFMNIGVNSPMTVRLEHLTLYRGSYTNTISYESYKQTCESNFDLLTSLLANQIPTKRQKLYITANQIATFLDIVHALSILRTDV